MLIREEEQLKGHHEHLNTHIVRFSDDAWKAAHALRRDRADREAPPIKGVVFQ